ncbi:NTE family protein [Granulicella rosea]|uniref:NTE family protein n=1 Tax=Granulicella rosea TaxID=474952 RepID=A0A239D8Z7_9BACT|nr:patatin-like phospholipase family protein [Granulicella rosea]SNS28093.1 NTE family protein [Granulicella rosea]
MQPKIGITIDVYSTPTNFIRSTCSNSARLLAGAVVVVSAFTGSLLCQTNAQPNTPATTPATAAAQIAPGARNGAPAANPQQGGDTKSASQQKENTRASGKLLALDPLAPAVAPPNRTGRPRIGLALGGGGALALSEIGALQWFEEHHIPVDVVAGTSMGCMVGALYSSGKTVDQLKRVMDDSVFNQVFSLSSSYQSRSYRRREDSRELPNAVAVGLKHGVHFRNSVLVDQGLNAFLDRQFLNYDDQTDFNNLPIPLRCISTDLNEAVPVTFARGSVPDAVRASVSLPGIFRPFEMNGHEYVDGGVLYNLPTQTVKDMNADVILAFSLPLAPTTNADLGSILGVLARSFSVAIEGAEREQRKLANVVIMPDLKGFGAADYLKAPELAVRGYQAAEANKAALLPYALSDQQWNAYLIAREAKRRAPAGPVLRVRVQAPGPDATRAIQRLFAPLVNQPVDTRKIEALLDQVRADGRYDVDYTVGYETAQQFAAQSNNQAAVPKDAADVKVATTLGQAPAPTAPTPKQQPGAPLPKPGTVPDAPSPGSGTTPQAITAENPTGAAPDLTADSLADIPVRPIILVTVADKKTGPPTLLVGANVEAQTTAVTRATIEGILIQQDFGGYGSELRSNFKLGYETEIGSEYFRPINFLSSVSGENHTVFYSPHADWLRQPYSIYRNQVRVADRQLQRVGGGLDLGVTNRRNMDLRGGVEFTYIDWTTLVGADGAPNFSGGSQRAHVRYTYDTQDRALVPQFGIHITTEAAFLYDAVGSRNAPQLSAQGSYSYSKKDEKGKAGKNTFVFASEGGTMFNRNVAEPFRYTLGGPLRLSASAIDEYRGTDYFLVEPAYLRRVASLPQPLGQNLYVGVAYEAAQMYAPGVSTITRQDVYFGVVAETPLGIITFAPAIGDDGHRKFVFTLGKLF